MESLRELYKIGVGPSSRRPFDETTKNIIKSLGNLSSGYTF